MIGASRITYSMASYKQLPEVFRRLHPRFKTPWLALVIFAGVAPIAILLPGDVNFVGTLYSFGATFSFTVAHASIVRLRMLPARGGGAPGKGAAEPSDRARRLAGVCDPRGIATGVSFLVILVQNEATRWTGIGWLVAGLVGYTVYRRYFLHEPLRATVRLPAAYGPALALEYRRVLVPIVRGQATDDAFDVARESRRRARRAHRRRPRARGTARPPAGRGAARPRWPRPTGSSTRLAGSASRTASRSFRGSSARAAPAPRSSRRRGGAAARSSSSARAAGMRCIARRAVFGDTVDYVLKQAPCRVMVVASEDGT